MVRETVKDMITDSNARRTGFATGCQLENMLCEALDRRIGSVVAEPYAQRFLVHGDIETLMQSIREFLKQSRVLDSLTGTLDQIIRIRRHQD